MKPSRTLEQDLLMLGGVGKVVDKIVEAVSQTAEDYAKHWSSEGYGVALMDDKSDKVVQAYFDSSDYPKLAGRMVEPGTQGAKIVGTHFSLELHSGQLEARMSQQQDEEDQRQYQKAMTESVKQGSSLDEDWKMRVRKSYDSLDELKSYDEIYGIVSRLGYSSAEELWEKNPIIAGSVNPADLRVIKEEEKEPWEMTRDEFIAQAKENGAEGSSEIPLVRSQGDKHENIVTQAVKDGKAVPAEVLKDYPQFKVQEAKENLPIKVGVEIMYGSPGALMRMMPTSITKIKNGYEVVGKLFLSGLWDDNHYFIIPEKLMGELGAKKETSFTNPEDNQSLVSIELTESESEDLPEFEVTGTIKLGYEWDVSAYVPTAEYNGPGSFRVESPEFSARLKDEVLLGGLQDKVSGYGSSDISFPFSLVIEAKDADEAKEKALASLSDKTQWDTNLYIEGEYQAEHPDMTITDITVEIDEVIQEDASSSARNRWSVEFDFEIEPLSDKQIDSYTEDMSGDLGGDVADLLKVYTEVRSPQSDESVLKIWGEGTLSSSHDLTGDEIANEVADIIGTYSYNNYKRSVNNLNILSSKKIVPKIGTLKEATVEGVTDIVGQKIIALRKMTKEEMANEGWDEHNVPQILVLANKSILYPSQDHEGNGPGAFWVIPAKGEPVQLWDKPQTVVGKTIRSVKLGTVKAKILGFDDPAVEIVLSNGAVVVPGTDNEGNGSGALFMAQGDKVFTVGESAEDNKQDFENSLKPRRGKLSDCKK